MVSTLIGIFLEAVERFDKPAQFMRKSSQGWESISARRALADVEQIAMGLRALGIQSGDHVAILAENRYEWPIVDLAILGLGAVTVPLYPTLTAAQCRGILANAEAKLVIASTGVQLEKLRSVASELPLIGTLVTMDAVAIADPRVVSLATVMERGAAVLADEPNAFRESAERARPDDVATIIYTSGTTGEPKGAMLTHSNIAFNVEASLKMIDFGGNDLCLSFLPLCHIFERMAGLYVMLRVGATIAYAQNMETVGADAIEVRPTVMMGVPRFYEKVHARVLDSRSRLSPLQRRIFDWGLAQCIERVRAHFQGREIRTLGTGLADRLVARKIRARVGGRLRFCISGSAPLSTQVIEFFFAIGIPIIEGYGMTETSPVICLNPPGRERPGSVGIPIPGIEVRLGDQSEIQTRGPHVMRGYWKNEAATLEAIRDGWMHTGDVGRFDSDGYLFITDRIKDLLVTAGGKKVAPQPLELKLKTSSIIAEAILIGDRRPYISCLIVPNFAQLETLAKSRGWNSESHAALIQRPEVVALFQAEIDRMNGDLAPFEQIKRFVLLDRELSAEAGEITPSLKVRRKVVAERFAPMIEGLYAGHSKPAVRA